MVTYDANIISEFADRLYRRANWIIFTCTLIGLIVGGVSGWYAQDSSKVWMPANVSVAGNKLGDFASALPFVTAGIVGVFGYLVGRERAFWLKLRAQTALCQLRIEENTRNSATVVSNARPEPFKRVSA